MGHTAALWISLAVLAAGILYRGAGWFRDGLSPATPGEAVGARVAAAARGVAASLLGRRIVPLLRAFVLDVLLQRRLLRESRARWLAHFCIFVAFTVLLVVHALGDVLVAPWMADYSPRLAGLAVLRDLLGAILLAGVAAAAYRRFVAKLPRRATNGADTYAIVLLAVIGLSGILLGAAKIGSYSSFRSMVETYAAPADAAPLEAYWVARMGTVSAAPHRPELVERGRELHEAACAACHASPRAAFVVNAVATVVRPVSLQLDAAGGGRVLWVIHYYACIVGLALLPFTKMFHLVATPISLLAAAAGDDRTADPANAATLRALHLDACTHCCACSVHCSMAVASDVYGNPNVLPSEKMAALRALRSGGALLAGELRAVQEGVCLCTSCERCTVACPSGIDLVGLWTSAKEALLARGEPAYALLSPLSLRRGLGSDRLEPAAYRAAVERPRQAIASRFGTAALADRTVALQAGDGRLLAALTASSQAGGAGSCFGCKTCTTACPVVREHAQPQQALGVLPHQVVYSARLGLEGLVLGSRMLWDCLGCYQCQELCPQGVAVTDVMYQLKNVAIAQAAGLAGADRPAAAPARAGRAA